MEKVKDLCSTTEMTEVSLEKLVWFQVPQNEEL